MFLVLGLVNMYKLQPSFFLSALSTKLLAQCKTQVEGEQFPFKVHCEQFKLGLNWADYKINNIK